MRIITKQSNNFIYTLMSAIIVSIKFREFCHDLLSPVSVEKLISLKSAWGRQNVYQWIFGKKWG